MAGHRSGGGPGRLITKLNTAAQTVTSVTVSVPSGGTSAWAQIIASTSVDTVITAVGFYTDAATTSGGAPAQVDIGYGGAGAETLLDSVFLFSGNTNAAWWPGGRADLPVLQRVASGQRVAVRGAQLVSWGSAFNFTIVLATVPLSAVENS